MIAYISILLMVAWVVAFSLWISDDAEETVPLSGELHDDTAPPCKGGFVNHTKVETKQVKCPNAFLR